MSKDKNQKTIFDTPDVSDIKEDSTDLTKGNVNGQYVCVIVPYGYNEQNAPKKRVLLNTIPRAGDHIIEQYPTCKKESLVVHVVHDTSSPHYDVILRTSHVCNH